MLELEKIMDAMNLNYKLKTLCRELGLLLPSLDEQGRVTLQFDEQLSVCFFKDKLQNVLVTDVFKLLDQHGNQWELIEAAMRLSYSWSGLSTQLALEHENRLQVQSIIAIDTPYNEFFNMTNMHCSLCEQIFKMMHKPTLQSLEHYAYITP